MFSLLSVFVAFTAAFTVLIHLRNREVFRYRHHILNIASERARKRMNAGDTNWEEEYDIFKKVTYDSMVYQFWKPVESFFPDHQD